jgi:hypothetical protein
MLLQGTSIAQIHSHAEPLPLLLLLPIVLIVVRTTGSLALPVAESALVPLSLPLLLMRGVTTATSSSDSTGSSALY